MNDTITSFPLVWPRDVPRCTERIYGQFEGTPGRIVCDLLKEIDRLSLGKKSRNRTVHESVIISTNAPLNKDGSVRADGLTRSMDDPGVAVYFPIKGVTTCIALDRYDRIWKNLRAVQRTLECFRAIERYGGSGLMNRAFTGFMALPAPGEVKARTCWEVLEIASTTSMEEINKAWRKRAEVCHPDKPGGSHDKMTELNTARDQAQLQATKP